MPNLSVFKQKWANKRQSKPHRRNVCNPRAVCGHFEIYGKSTPEFQNTPDNLNPSPIPKNS